jgi:acyl-CoA dehydrogenase
MDIFSHLPVAPFVNAEPATLEAWWPRFLNTRLPVSIDAALLGGFEADRLGFAFAAGYQSALRVAFPELGWEHVAALCASETGGAHPRAIETTLKDGVLNGNKHYVSMGASAKRLIVIARAPEEKDGRPVLHAVLVDATAAGVSFSPGEAKAVPFIPEVPHGTLVLKDARGTVLAGDGYAAFLKPFRTIEDIHVNAAIYAYSLRLLRQGEAPPLAIENALSLIASLHCLAGRDPHSSGTHLTLAGLLRAGKRFIASLESIIAGIGGDTYERWKRDQPLFSVSEKVRSLRTEAAWKALKA